MVFISIRVFTQFYVDLNLNSYSNDTFLLSHINPILDILRVYLKYSKQ